MLTVSAKALLLCEHIDAHETGEVTVVRICPRVIVPFFPSPPRDWFVWAWVEGEKDDIGEIAVHFTEPESGKCVTLENEAPQADGEESHLPPGCLARKELNFGERPSYFLRIGVPGLVFPHGGRYRLCLTFEGLQVMDVTIPVEKAPNS